jgi:hypothetical protein
MPTATYIALANVTLTSQATITFSSIPATYRDLVLVCSGTTSVNANLVTRVNGDSGTNYSWVYMSGNGTSATSGSNASDTSILQGATAFWISASPTNTIFNFMDYSATDKHKTVLVRTDGSTRATEAIASRWANTSAITSIAISLTSGTFTSGTMSLYGIVS